MKGKLSERLVKYEMIGDYDLELLDLFSSCPANFGFLVASVLLSLVSYQEDNFEHSPAFEMLHDR